MSGGFFDYEQYKIDRIADEVEQLIISNNYNALNEWGDPIGRGYSSETIEQFKTGLKVLKAAAIFAQRIDWLVSGDDGEENFHKRLLSDLEKMRDE